MESHDIIVESLDANELKLVNESRVSYTEEELVQSGELPFPIVMQGSGNEIRILVLVTAVIVLADEENQRVCQIVQILYVAARHIHPTEVAEIYHNGDYFHSEDVTDISQGLRILLVPYISTYAGRLFRLLLITPPGHASHPTLVPFFQVLFK
jgi:hypothetical protein